MQINQLTHIPFAFNKLKNLTTLMLFANQIRTVEDHDLIDLVKLDSLQLAGNPIEYIAPHAFSNNKKLQYIDLRQTKLQMVPEAVRYVPRLTTLDLHENTIDCSCRMSYLKGWNFTAVKTFTGNCQLQQTLTIKQYLLTQLPNCL